MLLMRLIPKYKSKSALNWAILATLGFVWGGSFLGVEISLIGFGPITVAASRVTIAAIVLLTYAYVFGDGLPRISSKKQTSVFGCTVWVWHYLQMQCRSACYHGVSKP